MNGKYVLRQGILDLKFMAWRDNRGFMHQKDADAAVRGCVRIVGKQRIRTGFARNFENTVRDLIPSTCQNGAGQHWRGRRIAPNIGHVHWGRLRNRRRPCIQW